MDYREDRERIDALLRGIAAASLPGISEALRRKFDDPSADVEIADRRGLGMISVADQGLKTLEQDKELKSYPESNHFFADLLVPLSSDISTPIVFWLSPSNSPGVSVLPLRDPRAILLSLGKPYSFADICASVSHVLSKQHVRVKYHWFAENLKKHGLDPTDPAFACLV